MSKNKRPVMTIARKQSVIATGLALSLMAAHSAYAQQAAPVEQKAEKIEVTGTRIPPPNLEGASPVTMIDAQSIKVEGVRSVENLLNNLPQVFADQGGNISGGSTGTATVNLRGLGAVRTLVLVNGRRLPAGSPRPAGTAADLNQVPAPLIKRVEILTGGAGAVYGSDAVAGVVNFIMNNKFEGVQVEANQSFYNHQQQNANSIGDIVAARQLTNPAQFIRPGDKSSDGKIFDANLLMGANFANGKGNATVFFNYKKEDALLQSERDFSACAIGSTSTGLSCLGSSTSYPGRFFRLDTGDSRTITNAAGNTRAFNGTLDQYNFAPTNFFQRPSERYGFNASSNYDLNENMNLYTEFSFHDDHTVAQIAPSGIFFGGVTFTLHFENPLLSPDLKRDFGLLKAGDTQDIFIGRRNVEGGGRQDDIRHTSFRTVVGVKGDFAKVWNYDVFMQTAKVIYENVYKNEFSNSRSATAIDVVTGPNGTPVCRSVVNGLDLNCVPYNLWSIGGVTPAALNYIGISGFQKGSTEQTIAGGSVSADLGSYGIKMPTAKNGVGVAFGAEQRTEKLTFDTDTEYSTNNLAGQGFATIGVQGKYTVKDIFTEVRAPLIEGAPFAHLLSVNGSWRHSDYSINQKTDSYGAGIEWAPVQAVRGRASYQRAARAANVHELFDAQSGNLFNMGPDPCGPIKSATFAQCQRTGVTAAQYGSGILDSPAGQYNLLSGGNPNLKPETSDSTTFGVVVEPMRNMSFTVDAFDIKIKDVISILPPQTTLAQCLFNGILCNLITRDIVGTLWAAPNGRIVATNVNIARLRTSGVDFGFNYSHKLESFGSVAVAMNGTLVTKAENEPIPGAGAYDCKGLHGIVCGVPTPKWRHKVRGTWTTPWNVDLSLTWRHIDSVANEGTNSNTNLASTLNDIDKSFAAKDYFDLAASWNVTKQLSLRGGINNVFDKDPPFSDFTVQGAGFSNGNTYPQVYDTLGRRVFLNATYKF